MSVYSLKRTDYVCKCDECGKMAIVPESTENYNAAQAVRSLGWSYGKDKSVYCKKCRLKRWNDRHIEHNRAYNLSDVLK